MSLLGLQQWQGTPEGCAFPRDTLHAHLPTLSEAVAVTAAVPETEEPLAGTLIETVGAVVSTLGTAAAVVNVELAEVARLPAASRDFTR